MREKIYKPHKELLDEAIMATERLVESLQFDLHNLIETWKPNKHNACICWLYEEEVEMQEGVYGSKKGMYLHDYCGNVAIYMPRFTQEYLSYAQTMKKIYANDKDLFYETRACLVDVEFDGKNAVILNFKCDVVDMTVDDYNAAKRRARRLAEFILCSKGNFAIDKVYTFECDDDGNEGFKENNKNYYVGVGVRYTID